jgi:hypothetical protein
MVMLLELLGKRKPYFARFATAMVQQFDALVQAPTFFLYG